MADMQVCAMASAQAADPNWPLLPRTVVNFIAGTKSVNVALWNQAMRTVGVPEAKWAEVRSKLMRLLLDEHDTILRSYQTQKRGGDTA